MYSYSLLLSSFNLNDFGSGGKRDFLSNQPETKVSSFFYFSEEIFRVAQKLCNGNY